MKAQQRPARKIALFSARMVRVGDRAPRVTRSKLSLQSNYYSADLVGLLDEMNSQQTPPSNGHISGDPSAYSVAVLNIFLHQGSDSSGNSHNKRQATLNKFGFTSAKKVRPRLQSDVNKVPSEVRP